MSSWLATRAGTPRFLLLRYEDMIENTARELRKIAEFMRVEPSPERLINAVERSAADRMRKLEKEQALAWSSTKETRQDIPFVRAAKAGGWRNELPPASVAEIEDAWGDVMQYLGYEVASITRSSRRSAFGALLAGTGV